MTHIQAVRLAELAVLQLNNVCTCIPLHEDTCRPMAIAPACFYISCTVLHENHVTLSLLQA